MCKSGLLMAPGGTSATMGRSPLYTPLILTRKVRPVRYDMVMEKRH